MSRRVITSGEQHHLIVDAWRKLYRADINGDMFFQLKLDASDQWQPLTSETAREQIWRAFYDLKVRVPWRHTNGTDIQIEGFERRVGKVAVWFICLHCQALYTDDPRVVAAIERQGCSQPQCPDRLHRQHQLEQGVRVECPHCMAEVLDPNGEIDNCPKCGKDLLKL
jgi:hypothetical protein